MCDECAGTVEDHRTVGHPEEGHFAPRKLIGDRFGVHQHDVVVVGQSGRDAGAVERELRPRRDGMRERRERREERADRNPRKAGPAAVATRTEAVAADVPMPGGAVVGSRSAETGVVVALSAMGLDDVRGVMATTSPATAMTASVPTASAAR